MEPQTKVFAAAQGQQADFQVAESRRRSEEACASEGADTDLAGTGLESEAMWHQSAAEVQPDTEVRRLVQSEVGMVGWGEIAARWDTVARL